jgi:uncharacterized delta-60 repeat protein
MRGRGNRQVRALIVCALLAGLSVASAGAAGVGGTLDPKFGSGGKAILGFGATSRDVAEAVAVQPTDGKVVIAGFSDGSGTNDFALARLTKSGVPDTSFGTGGKVITAFSSTANDSAGGVAIQQDGKIVVAGTSDATGKNTFAVARYTTSGALDPSFGSGGKVLTSIGTGFDGAGPVVIQPDGKILVAGTSQTSSQNLDFALLRYTTSGALDTTFGTGGKVLTSFGAPANDNAASIALKPNGDIVVAGNHETTSTADFAVARYTPAGVLDAGFGTGGKVLTSFSATRVAFVSGVGLQSNGDVVVSGYSDANQPAGTYDFALARYTPAGVLDTSFGSGGKVLTDFGSSTYDVAYGMTIEKRDKIVAAGVSDASDTNGDFALARYTKNGALDAGFGSGGKVLTDLASGSADSAQAIVFANRKLVVAGVTTANGSEDFAAARYSK